MSESSDRSTMKLWKWFCQEVAKSFRVYSKGRVLLTGKWSL